MSPVVSLSVVSCPVLWCTCTGKPLRRFLLRWWLGQPSGRESGQRLAISTPLLVAPAARLQRLGGGQDERSCLCLAECLLACLPAYLPDLAIVNGHGAHREHDLSLSLSSLSLLSLYSLRSISLLSLFSSLFLSSFLFASLLSSSPLRSSLLFFLSSSLSLSLSLSPSLSLSLSLLLTHMAGRQHSSWPCPWCDGSSDHDRL